MSKALQLHQIQCCSNNSRNGFPTMEEVKGNFDLVLVAVSKLIRTETEQLIYGSESFVADVGEPSAFSWVFPSLVSGMNSVRLLAWLETFCGVSNQHV